MRILMMMESEEEEKESKGIWEIKMVNKLLYLLTVHIFFLSSTACGLMLFDSFSIYWTPFSTENPFSSQALLRLRYESNLVYWPRLERANRSIFANCPARGQPLLSTLLALIVLAILCSLGFICMILVTIYGQRIMFGLGDGFYFPWDDLHYR